MGHKTDACSSIFRTLAKDPTANTLAISAASLVPLMAMVGGGVDASRYYMAETRLQAACDAGALAARRAMDDDTFTTEHKTIGENFFDQNYKDGLFGTESRTRVYSATNDGEVRGVASGTVPTSIMGAFGYNEFNLKVECEADINISNTDIMFVVDVTGSMGCTPDGSSCPGGGSSSSRLQGLRDAVMTFYDTVDSATSSSAQVRYGMVPYASNVNVGDELMAANPVWLAKSHTYQSREGELVVGPWEETGRSYNRTSGAENWNFIETRTDFTTQSSLSACQSRYDALRYFDEFNSSDEATWSDASVSGSNPRTTSYTGTVTFNYYGGNGDSSYSGNQCNLYIDYWTYDATADISISEEREETFEWIYRPVTYDLTSLYDDNEIELPTGWNLTDETVDWDGCVEEANTAEGATDFSPVPANAYDLDINLVPDNTNEYWKPVLYEAVWRREDASGNVLGELRGTDQFDQERRPSYSCPRDAFRLKDISRGDMQTYVDSLNASGNTYHDIGMIWGARFVSPRGIFKGANESAPNGDAIGRHIVFMTDGELVPNLEFYNTYGVEWWDRRISGDADYSTTFDNHAARFQAACKAARQENISVWVVAFGTTLTQNLIDCATPGRAFAAADSATLDARFKEIAQQIAALRLTQ